MLRTCVIERFSELEDLAPRWRRLMQRASHSQPVLTPMWLLAWWREFGACDRRVLRVLAVEDEGELVGLVPLHLRVALDRGAIPVRRLELLATGEHESEEICSEYVGVLAARGYEDQVANTAARVLRDGLLGAWDEVVMSAMSGADPLVPKLARSLRICGIAALVQQTGECPYVPLPRAWDEYLRALGSARRYVVTRSLRELDKWAGPGGWELRRARTVEDLAEGRRILYELHAERWESTNRCGVFVSPRFARFHERVMAQMLSEEDGVSLDLAWLLVRGEPIGAAYSIVYDGKVYFYQSGRRMDLPKFIRPGIAMHALSIRASIEAGRREYDFLGGASRYKRDLTLATRPLLTLRAVAPNLRARTIEAVRRIADHAARAVRVLHVAARPSGEARVAE